VQISAERVARLASELEALQEDLRATSPEVWRADEQRTPHRDLISLRLALDHMRLFLWAYLQAVRASGDVQAELNRARAERATDMLRELRSLLNNPSQTPIPLQPLLAEIHAIVSPATGTGRQGRNV
jgi:hypothetical protein